MSDDIAQLLEAGDVCGAAVRADELQDETVRAINDGDVPQEFQEELQSRVNELVNTVNCPPPPTEEEEEDEEEEDEEEEDEGGDGGDEGETETTETETDGGEARGRGKGKKKGKD
jgi:hypothetical protein